MNVVFLQDVLNVARAGEVKEVKMGYARNYLIPRQLASLATPEALERVESVKRAAEGRRLKQEEDMKGLVESLEGISINIKAHAGPMGKLYGGVTKAVIADELSKLMEREFDRRDVLLAEPIHELGSFQVSLRLHSQYSATVTVLVEPA